MRRLLTVAVLAMAVPGGGPVLACSMITNVMVFFDSGSSTLSPQAMNTLKMAADFAQYPGQLPAACIQFVVTGHADSLNDSPGQRCTRADPPPDLPAEPTIGPT